MNEASSWFATFRLGYRPELDGVRALAVIAVIIQHLQISWVSGFWVGVDIFFVLSGFLITTLLLQEWQQIGRIDLPRFYMRRAFRLLPALYFLIGIVAIAAALFAGPELKRHLRSAIPSALFYYYNWSRANGGLGDGPLGIMWSLAVEEQFYLLWPPALCLLLRWRVRLKRVAIGLVASAVMMTVWRVLLMEWVEAPVRRTYYGSDVTSPAILLGCFLAISLALGWIRPGRGLNRAAAAAGVALTLLALLLPASGAWSAYGGRAVVQLSAMVLLAAILVDLPRWAKYVLTVRLLQWIGRLSYGFYLWHYVVFWAFGRVTIMPTDHGPLSWLLFTVLRLSVTVTIVALSYYAVERPFLRLKRRYAAARRSSGGPALSDAPTASARAGG